MDKIDCSITILIHCIRKKEFDNTNMLIAK